VGLRDILTGRHEVKGPAPDRLFAISTAYVTLSSEHQIEPAGTAAIVFQALATSEFEATLRDMEHLVTATGGDSGTTVSTQDDSYGYRWMILRNPDGAPSVEDLAVGINAVSGSIETAGHGERLLCAVFAFTDRSPAAARAGGRVYFIYNYKRGFWYPFVPTDGGAPGAAELDGGGASAPAAQQRSTERELQIKAQMASELPMEPELERWFPLWGIPI
jgi:PspA associated protein B